MRHMVALNKFRSTVPIRPTTLQHPIRMTGNEASMIDLQDQP